MLACVYCNTGEWASTLSVFEELLRTEQEARERAATVDFVTPAPQSSQPASTATTATATREQKANRKAVKYCFEAALVAMEYTRQPQRALEVRSSTMPVPYSSILC
jgi:spore germination protein GerM